MFIGVYSLQKGVKLYENSFFHVYHIFQSCSSPQVFFLSLFSPFSSPASILAPSFPLLSCLIHGHTHTQTHIHTCPQVHTTTPTERCVLSSVCLSVCLVYASIKSHFGPQVRQSIFVLLCLAYVT